MHSFFSRRIFYQQQLNVMTVSLEAVGYEGYIIFPICTQTVTHATLQNICSFTIYQ